MWLKIGVMDAENSALAWGINYILQHIPIQNSYFKCEKKNNQINSALLIIRDFSQKHKKTLPTPNVWTVVYIDCYRWWKFSLICLTLLPLFGTHTAFENERKQAWPHEALFLATVKSLLHCQVQYFPMQLYSYMVRQVIIVLKPPDCRWLERDNKMSASNLTPWVHAGKRETFWGWPVWLWSSEEVLWAQGEQGQRVRTDNIAFKSTAESNSEL